MILTEISLHFPHLPSDLEDILILHVGDLHTHHYGHKEKILRKILLEGCDLIICSGDFCHQFSLGNPFYNTANLHAHHIGVSWKGINFPPDIPHALKVISRIFEGVECPLGIYAVQGNHDPDEFMHVLPAMNINVLKNETVQINTSSGQRLNLFGVHCYDRGPIDIPLTLQKMDPTLFTVGSCHYPEMAQPLAAAGIDLNLAGHTHGGQVCFPDGRPIVTHSLTGKKFVKGLERINDSYIYTTRGIGYSAAPVRLFCPPEVVRFTLKKGSHTQNKILEKKYH